jgi:hypothetical protein
LRFDMVEERDVQPINPTNQGLVIDSRLRHRRQDVTRRATASCNA